MNETLTARAYAAELQERVGFMVQAYRGKAVIVDGPSLDVLTRELEQAREREAQAVEALAEAIRWIGGWQRPMKRRPEVLAQLRAALARLREGGGS